MTKPDEAQMEALQELGASLLGRLVRGHKTNEETGDDSQLMATLEAVGTIDRDGLTVLVGIATGVLYSEMCEHAKTKGVSFDEHAFQVASGAAE